VSVFRYSFLPQSFWTSLLPYSQDRRPYFFLCVVTFLPLVRPPLSLLRRSAALRRLRFFFLSLFLPHLPSELSKRINARLRAPSLAPKQRYSFLLQSTIFFSFLLFLLFFLMDFSLPLSCDPNLFSDAARLTYFTIASLFSPSLLAPPLHSKVPTLLSLLPFELPLVLCILSHASICFAFPLPSLFSAAHHLRTFPLTIPFRFLL